MEAAKATPEQFGLKVRSHPDTLIVTARNKMGSSERLVVAVGLANRFVETAILKRDEYSLKANRKAAIRLVDEIRESGLSLTSDPESFNGHLVKKVSSMSVLNFLAAFSNHTGSFLTETDPVRKFIQERAESELSEWDVFFPSLKKRTDRTLVDDSLGFEINCQRRAPGKRSDEKTLLITNKQRVSSRGIESVGLSKTQISDAKEAYRNETNPPRKTEKLNYPDKVFRTQRKHPLLIVHMLAIGPELDDLSKNTPVVAWSISFPQTRLEEKNVEYVVNTTWFSERYKDEGDEDEAGGDDD